MAGDEGVYALQTIIRLSVGVSISTAAASLGMASATSAAAAAAAAGASVLPRAVASGHAPLQMTLQSSGPTLDDIQRRVYAAAATVLAQGPDSPPLEPSTSLWDLGMNSVNAVSLAAALEAEFGLSIPASIAFDYGTLKDLAGHIHSEYFAAAAAPVVVAAAIAAAAGAAAQTALLPVTMTVMLTGGVWPLASASSNFHPWFVGLSPETT
jgi:acyl carrier protein